MIFSWNNVRTLMLLTLVLVGVPLSIDAQSPEEVYSYASSINEGDFDFEMTPENPGPRQSVSFRIESNLVDLNRYPITWTVDGAVVASGIGTRTITATTKDYGQTTTVVASITLAESTITKQFVITPQDTTVFWEAVDAYAPPFYQGKRLPSYESLVRIISIPNFLGNKNSSETKNAVYIWKRNENVIPNAGGYGKDSILIQHNRVRTAEKISVTASSVSAAGQATKSVTIPFFDPIIIAYERNPSTGIRNPLAKKSLTVPSQGTLLEIEPYYFSTLQNNPTFLKIDWSLNNTPVTISDSRKKTTLSLTNPGSGGMATFRVNVENTTKLFQSAQSIITANLLQ